MLNIRKRSSTSCKKGNVVLNGMLFLIVIFVFSLVAMFGGQIFNEVGIDILNDVEHNESKAVFTEVESRYDSVFDGLIVIIFIGLWLIGIVSAVYSEQHPMIFGMMMFLLVAVLVVAGIFANFYDDFFADPEYGALKSDMPKMNWIMSHLLEVAVVMFLSIILALLGKNRV